MAFAYYSVKGMVKTIVTQTLQITMKKTSVAKVEVMMEEN